MAEYVTPSTVPNPSIQDVVLMDFACNPAKQVGQMGAPLTCPDSSLPGQSAFEQAWADQPSFLPTVIQVGQVGKQSAWWQGRKLASVIGGRTPKGTTPGRVAAIGFSEGCSGVKQLLSNYSDADQLDFVYACDGMAGQVDPKSNVFYTESIEPWVNFAMKAAQGKTMMVVTHTEIIPANRACPPPTGFSQCGVASTTESATALLQEVKKRMGYNQIAPRMIPRGLIGQAGYSPTPPDGQSWTSWVNAPSQPARMLAPWPVKYYEILGNLIVVGFKAQTQNDPAPASSSQSSHIFQAWWVMRQVIMEVLACRWAAKCDTVNINPDAVSGLGATPIQPTSYVDRRFPSVVQRPNPAMLRRVGSARRALGEVSQGCLVEGNFSKFSAADLQGGLASALNAYSPAELAVGALGLTVGGIALYKYLTR